MAITASTVVAYPPHVDFLEEIRPEIEGILGIRTTTSPEAAPAGAAAHAPLAPR